MLASYLQNLTSQLREKEDQYRRAMDEVERVSANLQGERERTHRLTNRTQDSDRRLRELEMVTRSSAERFVCFRCNTNPYLLGGVAAAGGSVINDDDGEGDGEGPMATPVGLPTGLLPLGPVPGRERSPDAMQHSPGRGGLVLGREGSPLDGRSYGSRSPPPAFDPPPPAQMTDASDSSSSSGDLIDAPSMGSGEVDGQSMSSGDGSMASGSERMSTRFRLQHQHGQLPIAVDALLRKVEAYKERAKRTKGRLRKALKAHAYERERVQEMNAQLEEVERHKQELISKFIASTSRLEENKRWMRKIKRSLQQEKEENLDKVNEQWRAQMALHARLREGGATEELRAKLDRKDEETATLRETVHSLKTMVGHLSAEYNRRVTDITSRVRDGRPFSEEDEDAERVRGASSTELRQENEALRGNVASLMKVMEHCYTENSHLSSLSNRLSTRLGEANDRLLTLETTRDGALDMITSPLRRGGSADSPLLDWRRGGGRSPAEASSPPLNGMGRRPVRQQREEDDEPPRRRPITTHSSARGRVGATRPQSHPVSAPSRGAAGYRADTPDSRLSRDRRSDPSDDRWAAV